ncbi:MAG: hypothetical protein LBS26_06845 [Campylobacteraceae bacterium]|jgi:uncharacterized membrane protein|nr:hypothetical protein [Campylobacteraceae bacterium]
MKSTAFSIYLTNLIMTVILCAGEFWYYINNAFLRTVWFFFIMIYITVFLLKNACDDAYYKKHFEYQHKIVLIFSLSYIASVFISIFLRNTAPEIIADSIGHYSAILITTVLGIWAIYKNINGLVYLVVNKDLPPKNS